MPAVGTTPPPEQMKHQPMRQDYVLRSKSANGYSQ